MIVPDVTDAFTPVYAAGQVNDHSFVRGPDGRWHLFHIWTRPEKDDVIGHATSDGDDLRSWTPQPDVLPKGPGPSWESRAGGSAPHVIRNDADGKYYLFYSRYDGTDHADYHPLFNDAYQRIGVATSDDLFRWNKHPGNPVFHPSEVWSAWGELRSEQNRPHCCRDPHVMRVGGRWVMYYVAMTRVRGYCAVAHAVSDDLLRWEDRGPVLITQVTFRGGGMTESPCVVHDDRSGRWWLFFVQGEGLWYAVSDERDGDDVAPFRFRDPMLFAPIRAPEIFHDGRRWLISHMNREGFLLAEIDLSANPPRLRPLSSRP